MPDQIQTAEQEVVQMLSQEDMTDATWEALKPRIVAYFDQVVKSLLAKATTSGPAHANIQPIPSFNPADHLMQIGYGTNRQDYLQVMWRLAWFRALCPHGKVETAIVHLDLDRPCEAIVEKWDQQQNKKVKTTKTGTGLAIFKAVVEDGLGGHGEGHGMENAAAFEAFLEKAETAAIGRALASLGYGTQFTGSEFKGRIVDAPVDNLDVTEPAAPSAPQAASNGHTAPKSNAKSRSSTPASAPATAPANEQPATKRDYSLVELKASAKRSVAGDWPKVVEQLATYNERAKALFWKNGQTLPDSLFIDHSWLRQEAVLAIKALAKSSPPAATTSTEISTVDSVQAFCLERFGEQRGPRQFARAAGHAREALELGDLPAEELPAEAIPLMMTYLQGEMARQVRATQPAPVKA